MTDDKLDTMHKAYGDAIDAAAVTVAGRPELVKRHLDFLAASVVQEIQVAHPEAPLAPQIERPDIRVHRKDEDDERGRYRPGDNRTFLSKHRANHASIKKAITAARRVKRK